MEGKGRQGFGDFLRADRYWMVVGRLSVNIEERRAAFVIVNVRLWAWLQCRWMQVKARVDTTVKAAEGGTGAVQVWHTNRPAG